MPRPRDTELYDIQRIMAILAAMPPSQRRRVLQYVTDRAELLPSFLPTRPAAPEEADLLRERETA
jgi:hypothetical protein